MADSQTHCLSCGRSDAEVPLLQITYQGKRYWICPQDLPILIHKPQQLSNVLPGIEDLSGVDLDH